MADVLIFVLGIGVDAIVVWFGSLLLRPPPVDTGWSVRSIQVRLEYEQPCAQCEVPIDSIAQQANGVTDAAPLPSADEVLAAVGGGCSTGSPLLAWPAELAKLYRQLAENAARRLEIRVRLKAVAAAVVPGSLVGYRRADTGQ
ncbi:hypothetical protein [Nocardia cyriacigeorgica]|uniref:hypothetical protein n=1 Tax=Nocardia cyriacigeorgica TaxID=135487 RepID=UPI002453CF7F|nr:hypothetical protein [Nocardia cyriacigeorgica]